MYTNNNNLLFLKLLAENSPEEFAVTFKPPEDIWWDYNEREIYKKWNRFWIGQLVQDAGEKGDNKPPPHSRLCSRKSSNETEICKLIGHDYSIIHMCVLFSVSLETFWIVLNTAPVSQTLFHKTSGVWTEIIDKNEEKKKEPMRYIESWTPIEVREGSILFF